MPGLLKHCAGPPKVDAGPAAGDEERGGFGSAGSHVRFLEKGIKILAKPPSDQVYGLLTLPLATHLRALLLPPPSLPTTAPSTGSAEPATVAHSSTDPNYDFTHWRMPGEDDQGQAARQALYDYPDSDTEDGFEGGDTGLEDSVGSLPLSPTPGASTSSGGGTPQHIKLEWDQDVELADRAREAKHDGIDRSFQVDRKVMRDIVREKMGFEVARIRFISSGTFHKAYLVTLSTSETLIARVARRFMPRLKTDSEVATLAYLRTYTKIPVPEVYAWDSNPYNRLGGEWILMSRARGVPLRKVYHSMPLEQLVALLRHLAELLMPLFGHRFSHIGSLYIGEGKFGSEVRAPAGEERTVDGVPEGDGDHGHVQTPVLRSFARTNPNDFDSGSSLPTPSRTPSASTIGLPTPRPGKFHFPFLSLTPAALTRASSSLARFSVSASASAHKFHVGAIISWPFFGSHRGELSHTSFPPEIERGPWASTTAYLRACANREVLGVARENEGRAKPHRLHLDPDDVIPKGKSKRGEYVWGYGYVRRTRVSGHGDDADGERDEDIEEVGSETPSDDRDDSDEDSDSGSPTPSISSDLDEDVMYRDYRRFQRSTFLIAEISKREKRVRSEMDRWRACMNALESLLKEVIESTQKNEGLPKDGGGGSDAAEGEMFGLDCHDLSLDNVFVDEKDPSKISCIIDWESTTTRPLWACAHLPSFLLSSPFSSNLFRKAVAALPPSRFPFANEWLLYERAGAPLRYAHKCAEWDGWEEGLVGSILGTVHSDADDELAPAPLAFPGALALAHVVPKEFWEEDGWEEPFVTQMRLGFGFGTGGNLPHPLAVAGDLSPSGTHGLRRASQSSTGSELERERMLDVKGDICGGRGGELGRRLEAWLIESSPERGTKRL
ncbi:hypothetical protein M0805_005494 [Coniferiporia weirii]|nr:hypothetical protein M0805_005494 [Coniferiporia weirii]